jgi:NAD(P)H-dependent FMN reductase
MSVRILAFAGSARRQSFNKKLLPVAVEGARAAGAAVTVVDLADFPMPIYDGDWEQDQGLPEHTLRLCDLFLAHDALLIACPEYNGGVTPLLKNALDWVSRPTKDRPSLACYKGKIAGLVSTSPGLRGGLTGMNMVRSILSVVGVLVIPDQMAIGTAGAAFDADGTLKDEAQAKAVRAVGQRLAEVAAKVRG